MERPDERGSAAQAGRPPDLPDVRALAALDEATRAVASVLDVEDVLQLIVDRVRPLVGARYAALGIVGRDGLIERFITSGISAEERRAIGPVPKGHGLLGLIIQAGHPIRVPDIAAHPASVGFPPNHPPMTSFLGVPVTARGRPVGHVYLTDKQDAAEFTVADERLVEMFALHAGIAMDNARLHDQVRALAVVEERDRIGRDLHDGIIQSLYAVSLSLEDLPDIVREAPDEADERVDRAIDAIQLTIRDIRSFIYGLVPDSLGDADLVPALAAHAEEFRRNTMVEVDLAIEPGAGAGLSGEARHHLLQLAREALSNAARHARASSLRVTLRAGDGTAGPLLEIADDGVGFDQATAAGAAAGHRGLQNMRARAEALGARLEIDSRPLGGTRIIVELPAPNEPGGRT